jgi:hypothetical protein
MRPHLSLPWPNPHIVINSLPWSIALVYLENNSKYYIVVSLILFNFRMFRDSVQSAWTQNMSFLRYFMRKNSTFSIAYALTYPYTHKEGRKLRVFSMRMLVFIKLLKNFLWCLRLKPRSRAEWTRILLPSYSPSKNISHFKNHFHFYLTYNFPMKYKKISSKDQQ